MPSLIKRDRTRSERRPNDVLLAIVTVIGLVIIAIMLAGCTVTPVTVEANTPSFDGNAQTSGFLGYTADGYGVITLHGKDRYDALAALYGSKFTPPVNPGDGCRSFTNGTWLIDSQHEVYFKTMVRWRREGK